MSDGQLALKAAKMAIIVLACLAAFAAVVIGLFVGVVKLAGPLGALLFFGACVFFLLWLVAAIDIHRKEEREAEKAKQK